MVRLEKSVVIRVNRSPDEEGGVIGEGGEGETCK